MSSNGSEEGVKDIFERDRSGERVSMSDPEFHRIYDVIHDTMTRLQGMNISVMTPGVGEQGVRRRHRHGVRRDPDAVPAVLHGLREEPEGREDVLIQQCCTFMDRCGITVGDNTFVAPKVNLITINHPAEPSQRDCTYGAPITIGRNVWIGIASTVLPGVTIGDNSIVGGELGRHARRAAQHHRRRVPARRIGDVPPERRRPCDRPPTGRTDGGVFGDPPLTAL